MGGGGGALPPHPTIFFENPPFKTDIPAMVCTSHLKIKPSPSEKQTPSLKREASFHKTIPRKNTINNNLNLAKILESV